MVYRLTLINRYSKYSWWWWWKILYFWCCPLTSSTLISSSHRTRLQYIISSPAVPLCACASSSPPSPSPTHHISSNFANRKQEISPNYDNSQNRFAYTIWINSIWIYVSHQAHCWRWNEWVRENCSVLQSTQLCCEILCQSHLES